ncbi:MAG: winged helix-turn-helix domain-containing protein [Sphingomonadales bacterium]
MVEDFHDPFEVGDYVVEPRLNRISTGPKHIALQPQAMDMLVYLAHRSGQVVSSDKLIEDIWNGVTVGSGSVYNCINELRRAFGDSKKAPKYIETIPKRGYRLVAQTSGIAGGNITGAEAAEASIAVLPFLNLSSDPEQEYFSDGISEELLNVLAKIPDLRVAARLSSFQFKGENRDITEIGGKLQVAYVLEGSVRKSGRQIRITAQLIDARNGFHLWSETYDRELVDIFAVQDEISAAIVAALKDHLGLEVATAPRVVAAANTEAHDAYLRGRYLVEQRTRIPNEAAVKQFEKAVVLDPAYALALAELAIAIRLQDRAMHGDLTQTESVARARPYAERALTLDPGLAQAHAAQAYVNWGSGALKEALAGFHRALEINPNYSIVYYWMAVLLGNDVGRWEGIDLGGYGDAFRAHETAMRLDPLSIPANSSYIICLINRGRFDEADHEMEKFASFASPSCTSDKKARRSSLSGKWANAVLAELEAVRDDPGFVWARNYVTLDFAKLGLGDEAMAISEVPLPFIWSMLGKPREAVSLAKTRLEEDPDSALAKRDLGLALAGAGEYETAGSILEKIWRLSAGLVTNYGLFTRHSSAALVAIRRESGEEAVADELLAALRDDVRRAREAGITQPAVDYWEGLADFLSGKCEQGLALIAKAAEDGFFIWPQEAYLQELYDHPDFAPIRAAQEARQSTERQKVLAVVCTNNPFASVWQPAVGTCAGFSVLD